MLWQYQRGRKNSFLKKKWGFKENLYDFIYNTLRHQAKRKAKQNKMRRPRIS